MRKMVETRYLVALFLLSLVIFTAAATTYSALPIRAKVVPSLIKDPVTLVLPPLVKGVYTYNAYGADVIVTGSTVFTSDSVNTARGIFIYNASSVYLKDVNIVVDEIHTGYKAGDCYIFSVSAKKVSGDNVNIVYKGGLYSLVGSYNQYLRIVGLNIYTEHPGEIKNVNIVLRPKEVYSDTLYSSSDWVRLTFIGLRISLTSDAFASTPYKIDNMKISIGYSLVNVTRGLNIPWAYGIMAWSTIPFSGTPYQYPGILDIGSLDLSVPCINTGRFSMIVYNGIYASNILTRIGQLYLHNVHLVVAEHNTRLSLRLARINVLEYPYGITYTSGYRIGRLILDDISTSGNNIGGLNIIGVDKAIGEFRYGSIITKNIDVAPSNPETSGLIPIYILTQMIEAPYNQAVRSQVDELTFNISSLKYPNMPAYTETYQDKINGGSMGVKKIMARYIVITKSSSILRYYDSHGSLETLVLKPGTTMVLRAEINYHTPSKYQIMLVSGKMIAFALSDPLKHKAIIIQVGGRTIKTYAAAFSMINGIVLGRGFVYLSGGRTLMVRPIFGAISGVSSNRL